MLNIGCHLSISNGFEAIGKQALEIGANTFQFFTRNPRGGSARKIEQADVEALKQLAWNSRQIEILEKSLDESIGVPEVPGSYYTARHVVNGIRKVCNDKEEPRETLIDYTRKVNEELTRKRQEFNLPVEE